MSSAFPTCRANSDTTDKRIFPDRIGKECAVMIPKSPERPYGVLYSAAPFEPQFMQFAFKDKEDHDRWANGPYGHRAIKDLATKINSMGDDENDHRHYLLWGEFVYLCDRMMAEWGETSLPLDIAATMVEARAVTPAMYLRPSPTR
jgi:hypothetical protein